MRYKWILLTLILALSFFSQCQLRAQEKKWEMTDHDKTNFPLIGKHRTTPCTDCHLKGVIKNTPTECHACHWERKKDDPYNLQLGNQCQDCHTPLDWKILRANAWNHGTATGFPLQGVHRTMDCFSCHKNYRFSGIPNDCFSCHREDYQSAREPDHAAAQFPTQCQVCHTSMVHWEDAVNPHLSFPLSGVHQTLECSACHKNGNYSGLSSQCIDCHLKDYNNAQNPNHKKNGFPFECVVCHTSMLTWNQAIYDHSQFPLTGAHNSLDCSQCHINNNYSGLSSECITCHLDEYNNTTKPNHLNAGFPTSCQNCHFSSHIYWEQGVFNHSFPIKSGKHKSFDCSECHLTANYNQFSCIHCHEHSKSEMDEEHDDVSGYSYNSQACYSCHPDGKDND